MILYMFDLICKDLKSYNTLKRRFYYQLKKTGIGNAPFKTKSVIAVRDSLEKEADGFFLKWEGAIIVFKSHTKEIYQLL
jgi:hypothetical protein